MKVMIKMMMIFAIISVTNAHLCIYSIYLLNLDLLHKQYDKDTQTSVD